MAKILIVDDSKVFRRILSTTLSEDGHTIIGEAANGEEALSMLENEPVDLVTLDITMPIMDGMDALKNIHDKYPTTKIVMVSASGQKDKVMEALKSGANDFLQKPLEPEEVIKVINRLVSK